MLCLLTERARSMLRELKTGKKTYLWTAHILLLCFYVHFINTGLVTLILRRLRQQACSTINDRVSLILAAKCLLVYSIYCQLCNIFSYQNLHYRKRVCSG